MLNAVSIDAKEIAAMAAESSAFYSYYRVAMGGGVCFNAKTISPASRSPFMEGALCLAKAKKVDIAEAFDILAHNAPELYEEYRASSCKLPDEPISAKTLISVAIAKAKAI